MAQHITCRTEVRRGGHDDGLRRKDEHIGNVDEPDEGDVLRLRGIEPLRRATEGKGYGWMGVPTLPQETLTSQSTRGAGWRGTKGTREGAGSELTR